MTPEYFINNKFMKYCKSIKQNYDIKRVIPIAKSSSVKLARSDIRSFQVTIFDRYG